jgi:hypothetical protein
MILTTVVLLGQAPGVSAQSIANPMALVDSWYWTYLGRSALNDPASAGWVNSLRRGSSPTSVLAGILGSDEYFRRVGGTMPAFIRAIYLQAVGRPPTPGESRFWLQRAFLQSRQEIANGILTQNPGAGIVPVPPIGVLPRDRDRWPRRAELDFRRPDFPFRW